MGSLNDYWKRQQLATLAAAQGYEASQGRDPSRVGQPDPGAPPAPGSYASGPATPTPGASSYVGQQSGGVSQTGSRDLFDVLGGQDKSHVDPALIASLPDAGDVAAVKAADAEYERLKADWERQILEKGRQLENADGPAELQRLAKELKALSASPPAKPDYTAIQHQSDRARLLNIGIGAYTPLISGLQSAAQGNGPSAALNYYRSAADDAAKRNYGMAASAKGTGGQRAALFQAAMGQNAEAAQGAARQAAIIGAEEQNQARGALNQALAGLTNVYGTSNLLGDTQGQQRANQDALNAATAANADIQKGNVERASNAAKSYMEAGGRAAGMGV